MRALTQQADTHTHMPQIQKRTEQRLDSASFCKQAISES